MVRDARRRAPRHQGLEHGSASETLLAGRLGRRLEREGVVFHIAGTQIQKRSAVIGRLNELELPLDRHQQAVGLRDDAEGSGVCGTDDAAIAMDAVATGLTVIRFGGRDGSLAAQPAAGSPARAKGIEAGIEAWLLPLHPNPEIGTSCVGGTERRRLGRVRLLDENGGPHDELSRVSSEMRGVVEALVAAGRRHFRRSDRRAKAVHQHRRHSRKGILQKQGGTLTDIQLGKTAPVYVAD